jgi:hypothetical protein
MLPQGQGGVLFAEYDYMDQNMNWSNGRPAPAANNGDKDIRTDFTTSVCNTVQPQLGFPSRIALRLSPLQANFGGWFHLLEHPWRCPSRRAFIPGFSRTCPPG